MTGTTPFQQRVGIILAVLMMVTLICLLHFTSEAGISPEFTPKSSQGRPDIIMIDLPPVPGGEQMPAVRFLHDRHTDALKGNKDCSACHLKTDKTTLFRFKRIKDSQPETDMAIYHDNCIGCHEETIRSGNAAGPIAGDCRSCHNRKATVVSSWESISFNKSLHYRHESSPSIKPAQMEGNTNCGACHHQFDAEKEKTVYVKGEEATCRYCHRSEKTKEAQSLKTASHSTCINCHQQILDESQKAGPINCGGCHDPAEQRKIETVEEVPRLKRNQPDMVLMAGWMVRPDPNVKPEKNHLNPVAFNHQAHESNTPDCKSCHHKSLKQCRECHTETGDKKGDFVRLETAMHGTQTKKSCMGCHQQAQTAQNCAGCHGSMPEKKFSETTCDRCHAVDNTGDKTGLDTLPMNTEQKAALAGKTLSRMSESPTLPPDEQIPENVTINIMVDEYDPVTLPHRRIIQKLAAGMKDNQMARIFHKEQTTMCKGCHHNSPASMQPPKCASCHGKAFKESIAERPGLKGAYHGQCMSCHQKMNIQEPKATDCTGCHKKRT